MSDQIVAVVGYCGPDVSGPCVMRGEELGRVVDSVVLDDCEVWQIEWPDGGVYLMTTKELSGVRQYRPPDRPPRT